MSKVGGYLAIPNTTCSGHPTKSGRAKKKASGIYVADFAKAITVSVCYVKKY
jgi:hypothetical protein